MSNLIVFKTKMFPTVSETFVTSNIVAAIKAGLSVKIVVDTVNPLNNSSQPELLQEYGLMDKVTSIRLPKSSFVRLIKALGYLIDPTLFRFFLKYCRLKKRVTLQFIFFLQFYKKLRKTKIFHVHFADSANPLLDLKEIGFLDTKVVVTFHGYDAHFIEQQNNEMVDCYLKHVDTITVNSEYLKEVLQAKGFESKQIDVVPIGIDCEFFRKDKARLYTENECKLITVGRLMPLKGQHLGIEAIKLLQNKGYRINYSLVGSGPQLDMLKKTATALGVQDSVDFLGPKNQSEIKELLSEHSIFLMTSIVDEDMRREAFGVVSLEAQAMGLPVIAFRSGGVPETLVENTTGFLVEEENVAAFAAKIESLITNANKLETMSTAAVDHVNKNFDIRTTSNKYIALYENL